MAVSTRSTYALFEQNYEFCLSVSFGHDISGPSLVLICVYICLVRPLNKQRRRMFRACTASSAAFIATSYMPQIPKMGTQVGTQSPKVNTTNSGPQKATEDKDEAVKEIVRDFWHTTELQEQQKSVSFLPIYFVPRLRDIWQMDILQTAHLADGYLADHTMCWLFLISFDQFRKMFSLSNVHLSHVLESELS